MNFLFLLSIVSTFLSAQTKVEEYPEWFLTPQAGEYIGISLPVKNAAPAQEQAVMTALMSYFAQRDIEGHYLDESVTLSDGNKERSTIKESFTLLLPLPAYRIVKNARNKYGETFVSISITAGQTTDTLLLDKIEMNEENDGLDFFSTNMLFKLCIDATSQDASFLLLQYTMEKRGETQPTVNIEAEILSKGTATEKCRIDEHIAYLYQPTHRFEEIYLSSSTENNVYIVDNVVNGGNLKYSLGAAYINALINLLSYNWDETEEGTRITSSESDWTSETVKSKRKASLLKSIVLLETNELILK